MWNRKTKDPLARLFLERYGLHMLSRPREAVAVTDVYPVKDNRVASPGSLSAFIGADLPLPAISYGEALVDISGTTSNEVSGQVGIKFLEGFFTAIGALPMFAKLSARIGAARSAAIRFRFSNALRDSIDIFAFERVLRKHQCSLDELILKEGYRYYVAVAVHRSDALAFKVADSKSAEIDFSADVKALSDGRIEYKAAGDRELVVKSDKLLAYGVELSELVFNPGRSRLELAMAKNYVKVMAGDDELPGSARSMIGDPEGSLVLEIPDNAYADR